jgi:hypothetical protein
VIVELPSVVIDVGSAVTVLCIWMWLKAWIRRYHRYQRSVTVSERERAAPAEDAAGQISGIPANRISVIEADLPEGSTFTE